MFTPVALVYDIDYKSTIASTMLVISYSKAGMLALPECGSHMTVRCDFVVERKVVRPDGPERSPEASSNPTIHLWTCPCLSQQGCAGSGHQFSPSFNTTMIPPPALKV